MANTIYVIVSGEYSDWEIHGFCETEDEAKAVCAARNSTYGGNYYYLSSDRISVEVKPSTVYLKRWCVPVKLRDDCRFELGTPRDDGYMYTTGKAKIYQTSSTRWNVDVYSASSDKEKILKLASDAWNKRLAEDLGL